MLEGDPGELKVKKMEIMDCVLRRYRSSDDGSQCKRLIAIGDSDVEVWRDPKRMHRRRNSMPFVWYTDNHTLLYVLWQM